MNNGNKITSFGKFHLISAFVYDDEYLWVLLWENMLIKTSLSTNDDKRNLFQPPPMIQTTTNQKEIIWIYILSLYSINICGYSHDINHSSHFLCKQFIFIFHIVNPEKFHTQELITMVNALSLFISLLVAPMPFYI